MSIEITNNYSYTLSDTACPTEGYISNYTSAKARQGEAAKTRASANCKNNVQEYYEKLCKKFPQINFNTNGGVLPGNSSKVTVNLSYDCLKKMAADPAFAQKMEWNLSGEAAANSLVYGYAKRDGVVLGGRTVTYDTNGNRQSSCGGMRTANANNQNSNINSLQKKYKTEEEHYLKARKRKEEKGKIRERQKVKKADDKRTAEKQACKKLTPFLMTSFDIKA